MKCDDLVLPIESGSEKKLVPVGDGRTEKSHPGKGFLVGVIGSGDDAEELTLFAKGVDAQLVVRLEVWCRKTRIESIQLRQFDRPDLFDAVNRVSDDRQRIPPVGTEELPGKDAFRR